MASTTPIIFEGETLELFQEIQSSLLNLQTSTLIFIVLFAFLSVLFILRS